MKRITLVLFAGLLLPACKNEEAPAPKPAGFSCDVAKINTAYVFGVIQANCTSRNCHPGGNTRPIADFSTPEKLKTYLSTKKATFGLHVTSAEADMPPARLYPPLSQGTRDSIACWITHGLPDQ